jgi:catechol 2,3-dioxygenase-like lactoylglutathione lyase family enzyme
MKQATESAQTGGVTTTVASTVMRVADLDRSVDFYRDVFCCRVALREPDTALLLTPDGFQIYLHSTGPSRRPRLAPIGIQYLMWATDSQDELERVTTRLRAHDRATYTYTERLDVRGGLRPRPWQGHRRLSQPEPAATRADRVAAARGSTRRDRSRSHTRSECRTGAQSLRPRARLPGLDESRGA